MTAEEALQKIREIIDDRWNWETAIGDIMDVFEEYDNSKKRQKIMGGNMIDFRGVLNVIRKARRDGTWCFDYVIKIHPSNWPFDESIIEMGDSQIIVVRDSIYPIDTIQLISLNDWGNISKFTDETIVVLNIDNLQVSTVKEKDEIPLTIL